MSKPQITPAMSELREAITEAEGLTKHDNLSKRDEARLNFLLAKIAVLRKDSTPVEDAPEGMRFGCTDLEKRWFGALQTSEMDAMRVLNPTLSDNELRNLQREQRDMLAGSQTITYTQSQLGGTLVPNEFVEDIFLGLAEIDPVFDKRYVTLLQTKGARPIHIPGWDLSTIQASRITEATQQPAGTFPAAATQPLGGWTYRVSLAASMEIEQDSFEAVIKMMKMAFTIAFARGVGKDLINGNGTNQPNGLAAIVPASGVTLNHALLRSLASPFVYDTSATLNDQFQQAYFSIDHVYRKASTCGWVMHDRTYQWIRSLTDNQGRPLINIRKDKEELMGKPVLISPSMPNFAGSPITPGKIVFGDLSRFLVRSSQMSLFRITEAPGFIEKGEALYTAHMRVDSQLHDPTGGGSPALVTISVN
jgi:HK97 family phage major capsid protein